MGSCEICGRNTEEMYRAEIEGTDMNVCKQCSSYGKVRYVPNSKKSEESFGGNIFRPKPQFEKKEEPELRIVNNYDIIIRRLREKSGLTQEDFAKTINEKLSNLKAMEGKRRIPDLKLAEKLEKQFGVTFIEESHDERVEQKETTSKEFSIGDMIVIKNRKKV